MSERMAWDGVSRIAAAAALGVGCLVVLQPFLTSALLAGVIALSVWPVHDALRRALRGRDGIAAAIVVGVLTLGVLAPLSWIVAVLAERTVPAVTWFVEALPGLVAAAPDRLAALPWVGPQLAAAWQHYADAPDELVTLAERAIQPAQDALVRVGMMLGEGVVTTALSLVICFFLLRDGPALAGEARRLADRLTGGLGDEVLHIVGGTVRSVIYGIFGTSAAQTTAAFLGFILAGAPSAVLMTALTLVSSVAPVGPPMVWGTVAFGLMRDGRPWAAGFMVVWGTFVISGIDNVVKPLIIARGASLPFLLVFGGVLGGVLAFGFVGVFLGPTLLALGLALTRHWLEAIDPLATTP